MQNKHQLVHVEGIVGQFKRGVVKDRNLGVISICIVLKVVVLTCPVTWL